MEDVEDDFVAQNQDYFVYGCNRRWTSFMRSNASLSQGQVIQLITIFLIKQVVEEIPIFTQEIVLQPKAFSSGQEK